MAEKAELSTELIGGLPHNWLPVDQGLPQTIDDAERLYGVDLYDRMLNSPDLQGLFNGLRAAALEQGWIVSPSIDKPLPSASEEEFEEFGRASEIADFVRDSVDKIAAGGRGLYSVLWEALGCLAKGHILAEVTYQPITRGTWKGKLGLKSIKTKPRQNYAIVVDPYNNFLGVTARQPGRQFVVRVGYIGDATQVPSFIGKDKFLLFSWDLRDDDPRGTSLLRGCYRPWKKEQLLDPERVRHAVQFGGGRISVIRGEASANNPGAGYQSNADVVETVKQWSGGGVVALEHGAEINVHTPASDGSVFLAEANDIRKQYAIALTTSIRAFLEAEHGSKADSAQGDKLLSAFIGAIHEHIEPIVRYQLFRVLVSINFGEEAADRYLPRFTLRRGGDDDFASNAKAMSDLAKAGMITEPMKPSIARDKLGIEYEPGENEDSESAITEDDPEETS